MDCHVISDRKRARNRNRRFRSFPLASLDEDDSVATWTRKCKILPAMRLPILKRREIPYDHLDSTYMFQPSREKPFVATPPAFALHQLETVSAFFKNEPPSTADSIICRFSRIRIETSRYGLLRMVMAGRLPPYCRPIIDVFQPLLQTELQNHQG